jgi:predicted DNA-binding transcriptional regulator AlpA
MPVTLENLLSENEISQIFGRSIPTLQKDRLRGNGPPFIKIGRLVRYSPSAVQAWLAIGQMFQDRKAALEDTCGETKN